ncbi:hypothetical protein B4N89_20535 [Embleya scabrispora]|uniref:Uncharacterized protein n=1 Tax=Embleya scabrispora TaxID=159449 RepID=A0A1T3P1M3_9ACTN|nr:hypothetical protein [Embleya scabrispora]OPC83003.1 hypothetical protein B4N89_20535 [Embleya scabrispora]
MKWQQILDHEDAVEADLHQVYGIDYDDALDRRSWRWMAVRIAGLLSTDSRLYRALTPRQDPAPGR